MNSDNHKNVDIQRSSLDFRTEAGFKRLYNENIKKLFSICYSNIRNREEAEEIVHEVFKSVWERKENIMDIDSSIDRYLVRSVKLKIIDYYRHQARFKSVINCALEDYCGSEHCTENQVDLAELKGKISTLVDQLPCQCREVYRLSREKGLNNRQIASSLLISEKTVESHMTKALSHLRKNLPEYSSLTIFMLFLI